MSFRQVASAIQVSRTVSHLPHLTNMPEEVIFLYDQSATAINLHCINCMSQHEGVRAYSIALDSSKCFVTADVDVRIRDCVGDMSKHFHLLAVPITYG